jgi:hypothetical protein
LTYVSEDDHVSDVPGKGNNSGMFHDLVREINLERHLEECERRVGSDVVATSLKILFHGTDVSSISAFGLLDDRVEIDAP